MSTTPVVVTSQELPFVDPTGLPKEYTRIPEPEGAVRCARCKDTGELPWVIWRPGFENVIVLESGADTCKCLCKFWPQVYRKLGEDISTAELVPTSKNKLKDRVKENLIIRGHWKDEICPQLFLPLADHLLRRGINWPLRITTDVDLKDAVMGALAVHKNASKYDVGQEGDIKTLEAYLGRPELLILRLGFAGGKNAGIPTAVKEALLYMEKIGSPTWIIDRADIPFNSTHPAWRPDVSDYLRDNFKVVKLGDGSNYLPEDSLDVDGPEAAAEKDPPSRKSPAPGNTHSKPNHPGWSEQDSRLLEPSTKKTKYYGRH